jgi:hypothetical protein
VPVEQHEDRLQQVVAVGAPAGDVQEQVQLGRRRHVVQRAHRLAVQDHAAGRLRWRRRLALRAQAAVGHRDRSAFPARTGVFTPASQSNSAVTGTGAPVACCTIASTEGNCRGRLPRRLEHGQAGLPAQHREGAAERVEQAEAALLGAAAQLEAGRERLAGLVLHGQREAAGADVLPARRSGRRARGGEAQAASSTSSQARGGAPEREMPPRQVTASRAGA